MIRIRAAGAVAVFLLLTAARWASAEGPETTTISAEGGALARSTSAQALTPAMPAGPPALSTAGAPDPQPNVGSTDAPPSGSPALPDSAANPSAAVAVAEPRPAFSRTTDRVPSATPLVRTPVVRTAVAADPPKPPSPDDAGRATSGRRRYLWLFLALGAAAIGFALR